MQARNLARRQPLVARLAAIVDIGRLHFWAVGELGQRVKDLRVPALRHEPLGVVLPASPARLTDNRQRRGAHVRQDQGAVSRHCPDDSASMRTPCSPAACRLEERLSVGCSRRRHDSRLSKKSKAKAQFRPWSVTQITAR